MWELIARDQVGLGWRTALEASTFTHLDALDVIEVIADDYFEAPGGMLRSMKSLAQEVSLVLHGVALGPASVVPVASKRVDRLARLINTLQPTQWSEHLAFVRGGPYDIGHLAAPPRNTATIAGTVNNIARIRAIVGVTPALENIATLIDPPDSPISEPEWVSAIAAASASPLLLDLHNLYANAVNFGHNPCEYLLRFPLDRVQLVHISGGRWIQLDSPQHGVAARRMLDDHVHDVPDIVFAMLVELAQRCPHPLTVILERDGRYPEFDVLLQQVRRAREALALGRSRSASLAEAAIPIVWEQQTPPPSDTLRSSYSRFETFLARLYCESRFLQEFMSAPERVARESGLDTREQQAALAIDRAGLLMAARSYELKRRGRRCDGSARRTPRGWHRILPLVEKFRAGRPTVDPHL